MRRDAAMKVLAVLGLLCAGVGCKPGEDSSSASAPAEGSAEWNKAAIAHYERYVFECGEKEIRCLWFPNKKLGEGAEMTLDLVSQTATAEQDFYGRPIKATPVKQLDAGQTAELTRLVGGLPPSDPKMEFAEGHRVGFWKNGQFVLRIYAHGSTSPALRRIYELGGGKMPGGVSNQ